MRNSIVKGAKPYFSDEDINSILGKVKRVLSTGMLTQGQISKEFERRFANYIGCKYAVSVNSGGTALEIALRAIDIQGSEVLVPTDTFIASANSIALAGAKPVFVDISPNTLSIDPDAVFDKINEKTKGIMLVHMFGLLTDDILKLKKICKEKNLFLIEDAAHAHGASYRDMKAGSLGDIGCFSLYATKVLTTGEGGMIVTNDEKVMEICSSIRNHGKDVSNDSFIRLGNNYRMAEIPAILGSSQLKRLDEFIVHRNEIAKCYIDCLGEIDYLSTYRPISDITHSYWRFPIVVKENFDRNKLQEDMANTYGVRITWMYDPLCHLQPFYSKYFGYKYGDFPNAEKIAKQLICLPTHMGIDIETAKYISQSLIETFKKM